MTRTALLFAFLTVFRISATAGTASFEFFTRTDLTTNSRASTAVAAADFNRDGIPDLAVLDSNGVSVFLGAGNGRFLPPIRIRILQGSNPYYNLTVADINCDGIPDLVVFDGYHIGRTLFGKGDGTFVVGPEFAEPPTNAFNQVFSADFNLDGKPDLALGSENGINILLGNGDGTFSPPKLLPVTGNRCIAVGDVNGDGKPDVIACGFNVEVFLGNGDGTFQKPRQSATPSQPVYLTVGDLNLDGKLDLAGVAIHDNGSNPYLGPVYVLYGNGDGTFQPALQIHSNVGPLFSVGIGDMNGDGLPDIVAGGLSGLIATLLNTGANDFKLGSVSPIAFDNAFYDNLLVADLNGDRLPDIVTSNSGGDYFSILFNLGHGLLKDLTSTEIPNRENGEFGYTVTGVVPIAQADFNRDGQDDFAFVLEDRKRTTQLAVYLGTGGIEHPFVKGPRMAVPTGAISIVAGDFNNDGRPDVAICNGQFSGASLEIYLGNGDGTFTPHGSIPVTGGDYMIVSDFNNDGNADIALSTGYLLLGHGDGTFSPPVRFYSGNPNVGDWLGAADFNHDGKMDMAFLPPEIGVLPQLNILLGNGDGTFQPPVQYGVGGDPVWGDIADFNGDGIPDIVVWNGGAGGIYPQDAGAILLGNGDGTFRQPTFVQGYNMRFPHMVLARDLNGDGHVDLAVLDGGSNSVFLFAGNGDGTFEPEVRIPGAAAMTTIASGYFHGRRHAGYPDLLTFDDGPNGFFDAGAAALSFSVLFNLGGH
jgi:hypothetical protein